MTPAERRKAAKALMDDAELLNGRARDLLRDLDLPAGEEIVLSDMLYRALHDLRTVTNVLRGKVGKAAET
ncbi:MAG TPA: hypothetical protein VFQ54_11550 [Thermomicrobiales bacterium]|nr:hypothetical protein [Thermomicrobiales bacterium]